MWKTKLGTCIYTSPSGYKVMQNPLYRWLTLGNNTLQTVISRCKPSKPILYYLPALTLMARNYPKDSCILGLGGAAIPHMLNMIHPHQQVTCVECSNEIIQIAKQFFKIEKIPQLNIIHQQAEDFVKEHLLKTTHLLVDLYDAHQIPHQCRTEVFFYNCKQCLSEEGYLAVNLANTKEQWSIMQSIKKQFRAYVVIPVPHCSNLIIIASSNPDKNLLVQQLKATGEVKKVAWAQDWGLIATIKSH